MTPLSPHQEEALKRFDEKFCWHDSYKAFFKADPDLEEVKAFVLSEISAAEARGIQRAKEAVEEAVVDSRECIECKPANPCEKHKWMILQNHADVAALDAIEGVGKKV